jgi:creatinine amidohydrolase
VETSLMMHLAPARVLADRIPPSVRMPLPTYTTMPEAVGRIPPSGVLASAQGASGEIGRMLANKLIAAIVRAIGDEFSAP